MIIGDILVGYVTSLLYDLSKALFKTKPGGPSKREELADIEAYVRHKSHSCNVEQDLADAVVAFLRAPQAADMVRDYSIYLLCGRTTGFQMAKNGPLDEAQVLNWLQREFLQAKHQTVVHYSPQAVRTHLAFIFRCAEDYATMLLTPGEKAQVSSLHKIMDNNFTVVLQRIDTLGEEIAKMTDIPLQAQQQGFEAVREEYMRVLRERYARAHIHMIADDLSFGDFYVPQRLQRLRQEASAIYPPMQLSPQQDLAEEYPGEVIFTPDFMIQREARHNLTNWKDIFLVNNLVYVIGGAGYGKSLFMQNLVVNHQALNVPNPEEYIVVLGNLKEFYQKGNGTPKSLVEFIRDSMQATTLIDKGRFDAAFVEHYLKAGRFILLLDALDEVEGARRGQLHGNLIAYFKTTNPKNKVCITSRERGFIPKKPIEAFQILPLKRRQVEEYVDNMIALSLFKREDREDFLHQAKDLMDKKFLSSFLILSLLINIYRSERRLPDTKLDLYEKCVSYIAMLREKEKSADAYNFDLISALMKDSTFIELALLGFPNNRMPSRTELCEYLVKVYKTKFASERESELAVEAFLDFCAERTELYVMPKDGRFQFFHRSFFEYFYAQYIAFRCHTAEEQYTQMMQFEPDSEIFELTAAMLKQKNEPAYQQLIELLLAKLEDDSTGTDEKIDCFDAMLLILPVMDDALYRNRFFEFLVQQKTQLLAWAAEGTDIINLGALVAFVTASPVYLPRFAQAYFSFAVHDLLANAFEEGLKETVQREIAQRQHRAAESGTSIEDSAVAAPSKIANNLIDSLDLYTEMVLEDEDARGEALRLMQLDTAALTKWLRQNLKNEAQARQAIAVLAWRDELTEEEKQFLYRSIERALTLYYSMKAPLHG